MQRMKENELREKLRQEQEKQFEESHWTLPGQSKKSARYESILFESLRLPRLKMMSKVRYLVCS